MADYIKLNIETMIKEHIKNILRMTMSFANTMYDRKQLKEYYSDLKKLKGAMPENYRFKIVADNPQLYDKVDSYGYCDPYIQQDIWAFSNVLDFKPDRLVDIASSTNFVAFSAQITKVLSIDLRIFNPSFPNQEFKQGDITNLPFEDNSVLAISTLSVIEHIGLGRYGDKININGMEKAAMELTRVLKPNGMLLVAFPTGKSNIISFNAHRICTPEEALGLFGGLELVDEKYALANKIIDRKNYDEIGRPYAYGCYRFTKRDNKRKLSN